MNGTNFVFHSIDGLNYKVNEMSINRGGTYVDSPKWLKNKKATINPKNNDNMCVNPNKPWLFERSFF